MIRNIRENTNIVLHSEHTALFSVVSKTIIIFVTILLAKGILCHGFSDYMSHITPLKGYKVLLMVLVVNCFVFLKDYMLCCCNI